MKALKIGAGLLFLAAAVAFLVPGIIAANRASNEDYRHNLYYRLKTLSSAEADFRANDRDMNKVEDFWTGDVAGLYYLEPSGPGSAIKLIDQTVADGDALPLPSHAAAKVPFRGYRVQALDRDDGFPGTEGEYKTDTDKSGRKVHHRSRFGFCMFPQPAAADSQIFLINENNTIFREQRSQPRTTYPGEEEHRKLLRKLD